MSMQVNNLSFSYGTRRVLDGISFAAKNGELLSVLGANGVGKSTLFRCMLGLNRHYSGEIKVDDTRVDTLTPGALAKHMAYIPQSHTHAFNYSVFDIVLMGTSAQVAFSGRPGIKERETVMESLEKLGIADFAPRDFMRLSGGEQQLVLIARALAQQSKTLIMDEPTANLDFGNQERVLRRIHLLAEEGYAIILSTHHPEQAYRFSHSILAMHGGRVAAHGSPRDVMTAELMQTLYNLPVQIESLYDDSVRVCVPILP